MADESEHPIGSKDIKLEHCLGGLHEDLVSMFNSSVRILKDSMLFDRVRMNAYSYREILNWLYVYVVKQGDELGSYEPGDIHVLAKKLIGSLDSKNIKNLTAIISGDLTWNSEQCGTANIVVAAVRDFKHGYDEHYESRAEKARLTIKALTKDNTDIPIEIDWINRAVKEYLEFGKYFNSVVHRKINVVDENEYLVQVENIKSFLLRIIKYDAREVFNSIDDIIKECEKND